LKGFRVVEFAGIGPGPFAAMLLSDMGAEVLRVERPQRGGGRPDAYRYDVMNRGRSSVILDLKQPAARDAALRLVERADAIIEGFRPGVMEGLGLGPEVCMARNPRLVYGRMTGWGQTGPMAAAAGHDINYIALSGALWAIGRKGEAPVPPLNLVGDFGGGGMFLAFGIVCAALEASRSKQGQIVDAAMVEGAATLSTFLYGMRAGGHWNDVRGDNIIDTGAPWYDVYQTSDDKYVCIGAIEPQFYALLLSLLGLDAADLPDQNDRAGWPVLRQRFADAFRRRTRSEWQEAIEGTDACFAAVLSPAEAPDHPHNLARGAFVNIDGIRQPAPAPRFSRTVPATPHAPHAPGADTLQSLQRWGFSSDEAELLCSQRVAIQAVSD
jgi:alpha-methylacyl-CoA racemase